MGAEVVQRRTGRVELHLGAVGVPQPGTRVGGEQPHPRRVVRRAEVVPRAATLAGASAGPGPARPRRARPPLPRSTRWPASVGRRAGERSGSARPRRSARRPADPRPARSRRTARARGLARPARGPRRPAAGSTRWPLPRLPAPAAGTRGRAAGRGRPGTPVGRPPPRPRARRGAGAARRARTTRRPPPAPRRARGTRPPRAAVASGHAPRIRSTSARWTRHWPRYGTRSEWASHHVLSAKTHSWARVTSSSRWQVTIAPQVTSPAACGESASDWTATIAWSMRATPLSRSPSSTSAWPRPSLPMVATSASAYRSPSSTISTNRSSAAAASPVSSRPSATGASSRPRSAQSRSPSSSSARASQPAPRPARPSSIRPNASQNALRAAAGPAPASTHASTARADQSSQPSGRVR